MNGFDIEAAGDNMTFSDCIAYTITNNSSNPAHLASGFGILNPIDEVEFQNLGTSTIVQNCIAQNIHGPAGATAAGLLLNAQKNVLIQNNTFNNNDNGILAKDMTRFLSSNGLIRYNVLDGNTFFGISDLSSANNAYYGSSCQSKWFRQF